LKKGRKGNTMKKKENEPIGFDLKETVVFTDYEGKSQKGEIVGLPEEGKTKYLVKLSDGTYPINQCYLKKE
jgi:hypothetical protein